MPSRSALPPPGQTLGGTARRACKGPGHIRPEFLASVRHAGPVNQAATLVARSFGFEFSILWPVVIAGADKDTAEPAVLSPARAGAILENVRAPSA